MKITRDELLIAAFKLFMSVNYEKASFAELGKMLGMSKAGIFKYYKNKQELFIAVVDKFCFSAQNPRNKFTETNGTFAEFIDEYVKGWYKESFHIMPNIFIFYFNFSNMTLTPKKSSIIL